MNRFDTFIGKMTELEISSEIEETMERALLADRCKDMAERLGGASVEEILEIGIDVGIDFAFGRIMEAKRMVEELQKDFDIDVTHYITYKLCAPKSRLTT